MRLTNKNYDDDVLEIQKTRKVVRPDGGLGNYSQWDYNNDLWNYVKVREDIEEEFSIDSYHIMKAMLNGYYWKGIDGRIYHYPELDFIRKDTGDESPCRLNHYYWNHTGKYLEDYGKTWALTREELL